MEEKRYVIGPPLPHVLEEELDDKTILFDSEQQLFVQLNATAAKRLSSSELTLEENIERLAGAYQTEAASIREASQEPSPGSPLRSSSPAVDH